MFLLLISGILAIVFRSQVGLDLHLVLLQAAFLQSVDLSQHPIVPIGPSRLDIAFYHQHFKVHVLSNLVVLSDVDQQIYVLVTSIT